MVKEFPELWQVTTVTMMVVSLRGLNPFFRTIEVDFPPAEFKHRVKKNRDALPLLTRVLLQRDFDLEKNLPARKLVPTLPNYVFFWLEDV